LIQKISQLNVMHFQIYYKNLNQCLQNHPFSPRKPSRKEMLSTRNNSPEAQRQSPLLALQHSLLIYLWRCLWSWLLSI
jgi:hypothetical protein